MVILIHWQSIFTSKAGLYSQKKHNNLIILTCHLSTNFILTNISARTRTSIQMRIRCHSVVQALFRNTHKSRERTIVIPPHATKHPRNRMLQNASTFLKNHDQSLDLESLKQLHEQVSGLKATSKKLMIEMPLSFVFCVFGGLLGDVLMASAFFPGLHE